MRKPKLSHRIRAQMSVSALYYLQNQNQYYNFEKICPIHQLHLIGQNHTINQNTLDQLPEEFILGILRNGLSVYKVVKGKSIEKLTGSIIGQKTIISILRIKFGNQILNTILKDAFIKGKNNNVDLFVEDIYGRTCHSLGLEGEMIASSLGKVGKGKKGQEYTKYDVARSLFTSFAINISNLLALSLIKNNCKFALILGNRIHNDIFYCLIQSILKVFSPQATTWFAKDAPFLGLLGNTELK